MLPGTVKDGLGSPVGLPWALPQGTSGVLTALKQVGLPAAWKLCPWACPCFLLLDVSSEFRIHSQRATSFDLAFLIMLER